jgi:hypothetical protein
VIRGALDSILIWIGVIGNRLGKRRMSTKEGGDSSGSMGGAT